jgi:hypothetical protein
MDIAKKMAQTIHIALVTSFIEAIGLDLRGDTCFLVSHFVID